MVIAMLHKFLEHGYEYPKQLEGFPKFPGNKRLDAVIIILKYQKQFKKQEVHQLHIVIVMLHKFLQQGYEYQ